MQIGEAATASGVTAKMIRHYEAIGLVPVADRRSSNYRDYTHRDVHRLAFVRRARDLGFSMEEIRELLRLWTDPERSSAEVKALAQTHLSELDERIELLQGMRSSLNHLIKSCHGNHHADCPIIDALQGELPIEYPHLHQREHRHRS
jgi:MerR family copper efflux transcriptional regulator